MDQNFLGANHPQLPTSQGSGGHFCRDRIELERLADADFFQKSIGRSLRFGYQFGCWFGCCHLDVGGLGFGFCLERNQLLGDCHSGDFGGGIGAFGRESGGLASERQYDFANCRINVWKCGFGCGFGPILFLRRRSPEALHGLVDGEFGGFGLDSGVDFGHSDRLRKLAGFPFDQVPQCLAIGRKLRPQHGHPNRTNALGDDLEHGDFSGRNYGFLWPNCLFGDCRATFGEDGLEEFGPPGLVSGFGIDRRDFAFALRCGGAIAGFRKYAADQCGYIAGWCADRNYSDFEKKLQQRLLIR